MPVVAQNANTALNLDQFSGTDVLSTSGNVYYIQNVATGLYLKAGGEWGTNAVEGRAAHPFYLEKRSDGSYAISSIAGFLHSTDMWADWKLRNDSRWTITKVSGLASGVNQFYLENANGRALSSQGHVTGQLMMDKHHAASYAQKWIFITEDQMKEQMSGATATKPMDITPLIKASSFDLVDGIVMNEPDEEEPWKDDNGNNIPSLPLYSKLTQAAYNRYWSNFDDYGRYNWHSMIRGEWGQTSVYNGVGIISEGNMSRSINVTQTVNSLPKGKYYFSFEGFYRYQTSSGFFGGFLDAIGDAFRDIKFQVVISAGNTTIKTFDLQANTNIAIDSDPLEKAGQEVAKVFRDNDNYKQFYEFDLTSQSNVTITIRKTSTSSSNAWICVDNFALVYYGDQSNTPDVEDLSELYNSRLEAYIEKIREELRNYPGATEELRKEALGVFDDGIVDVENAMANKEITTEELYREALSVIDQAYREALALLNKPVEGDYTHLIGNPSFEFVADGHSDIAKNWVRHGSSNREQNSIATDQSHVGISSGLPLVQKVNDLPYGLYRMTADVSAAAGNTVYLMGNYYHKGVTITNANQMQPVELYFLLDDGYAGDAEATLSTVIGAIGGSGEGNKYYNFHGGIESATETVTKQVTEEVTKQVEKTRDKEYTETGLSTPALSISSSNYNKGTLTLSDNKGSFSYTSDGSWHNRSYNDWSQYCYLSKDQKLTITANANSGQTLLITKVTITCTSSSYRGGSYTLSNGVTSSTSGSNIVLTSTNGVQSVSLTNGSDTQLRPSKITVECKRTYMGTETYYETVTETVTKTVTEEVSYDKLTADQTIQGCAFKVDNFKLYRVCDVPNGRLYMELQKARNAQFADGVTTDIVQYESMFQNRLVANDASSDYGYNPALRVMEILRNTAKQQRSAGADMTYAIYNQNFDYWSGHGWSAPGSSDTGDRNNHFQYTTSVTDAEGKRLFNTWWQGTPLTQTITGIPNGRYKLEAMVASGDPGNPGTVYLTARTTAQEELYKQGIIDQSCGAVFNNVELTFEVTDGTVTIGVVGGTDPENANTLGDYIADGHWWYKADNFRLTYLGNEIEFFEKNTEIEQVEDNYTKVTLNRTLKANSTWSSFVVPFDIPADQLTGWEVKELISSELKNNGEHISLIFGDATDGIKAGIPYMVRNTSLTDAVTKIEMSNVGVNTKVLNHRATEVIAFMGVYARQQIPAGAYFISDNKFYKAVDTSVNTSAKPDMISGFRGYFKVLETDATANVRSMSFRIQGEDETDIEDVAIEEEVTVIGIYDINGIRLSEMKPGINILRMNNGTTKRVMVK